MAVVADNNTDILINIMKIWLLIIILRSFSVFFSLRGPEWVRALWGEKHSIAYVLCLHLWCACDKCSSIERVKESTFDVGK